MGIKKFLGLEVSFEHERRFGVDIKILPFLFGEYPSATILQGYLGEPSRIRVRDECLNGKHIYTQTIKSGTGISRSEDECEITEGEFNRLWEKVECCLEKDRYFIPWSGFEVQLNIFRNNLEGYAQIEVEFESGKTALAFVPPDWFGKEVTDDHRHGNYSLAKNGIPK